MDARQQRGLLIAKSRRVYFNGKAWIVPSQSDRGTYAVDLNTTACSCDDFRERQLPCKHIHAARLTRDNRDGLDRLEGNETPPPRATYPQRWPAYSTAQRHEKELVRELLRGLCEGIQQPPYRGKGRPLLPLADLVYSLVMRVYTGLSARRADTDVRECEARGMTATAPSYNAVLAAMQRPDLTPILTAMIEASAAPLASIETDFSVDGTVFATSTYARWYDEKYGRDRRKQQWVKLHAAVGNTTNIITAAVVTDGDSNDSPEMPGLLLRTAERFDVRAVQGDRAYLSHQNLEAIEAVGGTPYVPFKVNSTASGTAGGSKGSEAWRRMWLRFQVDREAFLAGYHRRSNSESTFSALKRLFGSSLRSKKRTAQVNELLAKVLAYNLTVIVHAVFDLGIDPGFGLSSLAAE